MKRFTPRFLYGFLSASAEAINIRLPWQPSDRDGLFLMNYNTSDAERDNLILWAHTNKGERVMDFDFGLDARRYLFDPITFSKDNLTQNARVQLKKYFSHLVVERLDFIFSDQDKSIQENSLRFELVVRTKEGAQIEISEVLS